MDLGSNSFKRCEDLLRFACFELKHKYEMHIIVQEMHGFCVLHLNCQLAEEEMKGM